MFCWLSSLSFVVILNDVILGLAVMLWRIFNNCEPRELFWDLPPHGFQNKQQQIFHLQQSNRERRGTFSFCNRLNDIIPLLSDKQLNENEPETKRIFKPKNLETLSDKCDIF